MPHFALQAQMIASTLLEAMAALAVALTVLGTLAASLAASGAASLGAWRLAYAISETRQIEHLLEATLARASAAGGRVAACSADELVFEADLDGNGSVDSSSSERTAFVLSNRSGGRRALSQRLGRQSITVVDSLTSTARVRCVDQHGIETTDPLALRLVEVPVTAGSTRQLAVAMEL
jgi:hypothetical protein